MKKSEIVKRAKRIKAIIADVDGVLTDGRIVYRHDAKEIKVFNVKDGLAVKLARQAGIKIFLISGRSSPALLRRSREMGVERLWQGATNKLPIFDIIKKKYGLIPGQICCIGDDLPDLKLLSNAGLGVAVPDAPEDVRRAADLNTEKRGGMGVLREMVEFILKAQGKWKNVIKHYKA